jgi:tRNA-uridine 2-sulfurtransferase
MKKALVLFSGGLDSRLCIKILEKKGYKVTALYIKLPFIKDKDLNFKCELKIIDCVNSKYFQQYMKLLKKPIYGYGKGINPCIDCKLFMFKIAENYAKKNNFDLIATGTIRGQRPMSQSDKALSIFKKQFKEKICHPLNELGIVGRQRKEQIRLAKEFKITYPEPGGGCILCEPEFGKRLRILIKNKLLNKRTFEISKIGRHFLINNCWFIVSRDEAESLILEKKKNTLKSSKGIPAVYFNKSSEKRKAFELQKAYELKNAKNFEEFRI